MRGLKLSSGKCLGNSPITVNILADSLQAPNAMLFFALPRYVLCIYGRFL